MSCLVDIPGGLPFSKAEGREVDLGKRGVGGGGSVRRRGSKNCCLDVINEKCILKNNYHTNKYVKFPNLLTFTWEHKCLQVFPTAVLVRL